MKRLIYLLTILLVACSGQGDVAETAVTPPVVARATATNIPPASTTAPTEPVAEPTNPTDVPTDVPNPTATPQPLPTATDVPNSPINSLNLVPVAEGFFKPNYLTHAGDDRLFVVQQHGVVAIIQNGQVLDTPFLDMQNTVNSNAYEQGLLSIAFHPNYGENGRFFIYYTQDDDSVVISRLTVSDDPNQADPTSEKIIMTIPQPYRNHNGGQLKFGPDGYLYVGLGDGGSADDPLEHGQNSNTLLGSILRLDVDYEGEDSPYAIPADNPFVEGGGRAEIWAYGLRNPWRFSFDRLTGDLFVADVGQNIWEEIHFAPAQEGAGWNYGWNILEGSNCFLTSGCDTSGLVLPIFEYTHQGNGCSVTGGYIYRGQAYPELQGNYILGDYCTGKLWRLFQQEDGAWLSAEVGIANGRQISSFGEDANGELYLVDHLGSVLQITP